MDLVRQAIDEVSVPTTGGKGVTSKLKVYANEQLERPSLVVLCGACALAFAVVLYFTRPDYILDDDSVSIVRLVLFSVLVSGGVFLAMDAFGLRPS
jgi:hypothetical protein